MSSPLTTIKLLHRIKTYIKETEGSLDYYVEKEIVQKGAFYPKETFDNLASLLNPGMNTQEITEILGKNSLKNLDLESIGFDKEKIS